MERNDTKSLINLGVITAFIVLAFIGTTVLRIPIPATGGYFNLGDTFVMLSALLYGPVVGLAVGFIGPTLADAIGFPQFVVATAVTKGIEGALVGIIAYRAKSHWRIKLSLAVGILTIVLGYFVFEAYIYPALGESIPFFAVTDVKLATAEILPNTLQGLFSAILAFGIWKMFGKLESSSPIQNES